MNYEGNDWGYFGFVHVVGLIAYGVFALLALAVVTGLVILLVRFLLIGTKAAQLYIAKNGVAKNDAATTAPSKPAAPESRPTPTASAPETTTPLSPVDAAIAPTPPKTSPATSTSSTTTPLPAAGTTAPKAAAKKPATRTPKTPPTV